MFNPATVLTHYTYLSMKEFYISIHLILKSPTSAFILKLHNSIQAVADNRADSSRVKHVRDRFGTKEHVSDAKNEKIIKHVSNL